MQDALLNHHELALQADGKEAWAFLTAAGEPYQFFWPAAVELAFASTRLCQMLASADPPG